MNPTTIDPPIIKFDYHQSDKDDKWYWTMYQGKDKIGRSTDPKDDMLDCFLQILSVIQTIRTQSRISIIDRSTGFILLNI